MEALATLQDIMQYLGVVQAKHKVHQPSQCMIWLGIRYDTITMEMAIPPGKMRQWHERTRAMHRQVQSLVGLLQLVASLLPSVGVFSNRILQFLRDIPSRGSHGLSLGF